MLSRNGSRKLRGQSSGCVIAIQEPYPFMGIDPARSAPLEVIRCKPWALMSCNKVGLGSKLHTTNSLELCVAALTGNKISKHLNRPSIHAVVRFQSLYSSEQHAQTVGDLFPSSVVAEPAATVGEIFSFHRQRYSPTRGDTGVAKRRSSDNEGSTCEVLFVSWQQVRCHEMLNMSILMYVCSVHDGVQMILSVGPHTKCLQMRVYPNIEPTTIELEVSTPLSDEHVCEKNLPPAFVTM